MPSGCVVRHRVFCNLDVSQVLAIRITYSSLWIASVFLQSGPEYFIFAVSETFGSFSLSKANIMHIKNGAFLEVVVWTLIGNQTGYLVVLVSMTLNEPGPGFQGRKHF